MEQENRTGSKGRAGEGEGGRACCVIVMELQIEKYEDVNIS